MDEAEILSDRVCILDNGLVKVVDTPDNLKKTYNKEKLEDIFVQLVTEEAEQ